MAALPPIGSSHPPSLPPGDSVRPLPPENPGLRARVAAAASSGLASLASTGTAALTWLFASDEAAREGVAAPDVAPRESLTLIPGMAGYEEGEEEVAPLAAPLAVEDTAEITAARKNVERAQLNYDLSETNEETTTAFEALERAQAHLEGLLHPPVITPADVLASTTTGYLLGAAAHGLSAAGSAIASTAAGKATISAVHKAQDHAQKAKRLVRWVRSLRDTAPPGTTSALTKVAQLTQAVYDRKPHEEVYVLSVKAARADKVARAGEEETVAEKVLLTAHSKARTAISDTEEILRAHGFEEVPTLQQTPVAPLGHVLPVFEKHTLAGLKESDKALCQNLSKKAKNMSAIAILHSVILRRNLTFEQLKYFTAQKHPLKAYFAELSFFPWLIAKFSYLFIRPCLNLVFNWHNKENPGLAAQLVSIVRERLSNPHMRQTFISTLLSDLNQISLQGKKGRKDLSSANTSQLNALFASWIKKRIFIRTGWPLIGPFVDRLIENSIMRVIKSQNIPKQIQNLYTPGKPNTVHPVLLELVQSLESLTKEWMTTQKASQAETLAALTRREHKPLLDLPASASLPLLYNDQGELLDLQKIIRNLTDYLAVQGADTEEELGELRLQSRFQIHLKELQKADPEKAKKYIQYLQELDAFLKIVGQNKKITIAGMPTTISISDKIEEKVDHTIESLLKSSLASLLQKLSDESSIEALLTTAVSFAEKFLTTKELTPAEAEQQRRALEKSSKSLNQNVKQMINDVIAFQFNPVVQKENLEEANRYAIECVNKLKSDVTRITTDIQGLTTSLTTLTSLEEVRVAKQQLQRAGKELVSLKDSYANRLKQIYEAPQGAFSDHERMALMTQIERDVQRLKGLSSQIGTLTTENLPRIEKHFLTLQALQKIPPAEHTEIPNLKPYYLLLHDLKEAGWTDDNIQFTSFQVTIHALHECQTRANNHLQQERVLRAALAAVNNLQEKRNPNGATLFSEVEIQAAFRTAETALRDLIKQRMLTDTALHDLANGTSLEQLLNILRRKHAYFQDEGTKEVASGLEKLNEIHAKILSVRTATSEALEQAKIQCQGIKTSFLTPELDELHRSASTLHKTPLSAIEALPDVNTQRLQPLVDSYLSFLGSAAQTFITSSFNLHLLTEAQLERLRKTLS